MPGVHPLYGLNSLPPIIHGLCFGLCHPSLQRGVLSFCSGCQVWPVTCRPHVHRCLEKRSFPAAGPRVRNDLISPRAVHLQSTCHLLVVSVCTTMACGGPPGGRTAWSSQQVAQRQQPTRTRGWVQLGPPGPLRLNGLCANMGPKPRLLWGQGSLLMVLLWPQEADTVLIQDSSSCGGSEGPD